MQPRDGIIRLARSRDDAAPEWRWFWDRLAVAWVPALDPFLAVGQNGSAPVVFSSTDYTIRPGTEGTAELWHSQATAPVQTNPSALNAGLTVLDNLRVRARGNRSVHSALSDGTNRAGTYVTLGDGGWNRLLEPPGNFDPIGLTLPLSARSITLHSVAGGDQRSYLNGVAGTAYSSAYSPSWGAATGLVVCNTDAALECYHEWSLSCVLIGSTSANEVTRLSDIATTLAPFRWARRRAYSFAAAPASPTGVGSYYYLRRRLESAG